MLFALARQKPRLPTLIKCWKSEKFRHEEKKRASETERETFAQKISKAFYVLVFVLRARQKCLHSGLSRRPRLQRYFYV